MEYVIDEEGNLYEIEDKSVLKKPDTISAYDENGEKFEFSKKDAEKRKLTDDQAKELIYRVMPRYDRFLNMYFRAHPEAAFARAPEAYIYYPATGLYYRIP